MREVREVERDICRWELARERDKDVEPVFQMLNMFVFHVKFGSFCFHNFIPCVLHQLLYDSNYCHLPLGFYIFSLPQLQMLLHRTLHSQW